jgi:DNA-binding CsgD family transcriptional regulator
MKVFPSHVNIFIAKSKYGNMTVSIYKWSDFSILKFLPQLQIFLMVADNFLCGEQSYTFRATDRSQELLTVLSKYKYIDGLPRATDPTFVLDSQQKEALRFLSDGLDYQEIAQKMNASESQIRVLIRELRKEVYNVNSQKELLDFARSRGHLEP